MVKKIKIYQISENTNYEFMDYNYAKDHGFNIENYKEVYSCEREFDSSDNDTAVLDEVFEEFNTARPEDYNGRSLSVSDVVEIDGRKWYCNAFGWQELE